MRIRMLRRAAMLALACTLLQFGGPGVVTAAEPTLGTAVVQDGLVIPWDVAFTPAGQMLVTERPGRVRVYASGATDAPLVRTVVIPGVRAEAEAGLMGIAVDVASCDERLRLRLRIAGCRPARGATRSCATGLPPMAPGPTSW